MTKRLCYVRYIVTECSFSMTFDKNAAATWGINSQMLIGLHTMSLTDIRISLADWLGKLYRKLKKCADYFRVSAPATLNAIRHVCLHPWACKKIISLPRRMCFLRLPYVTHLWSRRLTLDWMLMKRLRAYMRGRISRMLMNANCVSKALSDVPNYQQYDLSNLPWINAADKY